MTAETGETPKVVVTGESFLEALKSDEELGLDAGFWLDLIKEETPAEIWSTFASRPLTVEAFERLANAVQGTIAEDLRHWSDQEFYDSQRKTGRSLLRKLYEKGAEAGLELDMTGANRPFSILEAMIASGAVEELTIPRDEAEDDPA